MTDPTERQSIWESVDDRDPPRRRQVLSAGNIVGAAFVLAGIATIVRGYMMWARLVPIVCDGQSMQQGGRCEFIWYVGDYTEMGDRQALVGLFVIVIGILFTLFLLAAWATITRPG